MLEKLASLKSFLVRLWQYPYWQKISTFPYKETYEKVRDFPYKETIKNYDYKGKYEATKEAVLTYDYQGKYTEIKDYVMANKRKVALYSILSPIAFVVFLFCCTWLGIFGHMPSKKELLKVKNPISSTLYGANRQVISLYYVQHRTNIDSSEISKYVRDALVATEDVRFYEHSGIDFRSFGRVLVKSFLLQKRSSGGGSTLTQQLVKNVYGRKKYWFFSTMINKFREMILALRIEKVYDKADILTLYLNTVSFGENVYGIELAANRFFNKKPKNLTLAESATLVGMLKAPTAYNPRKFPEKAKNRRNTVLSQMTKYKFLTKKMEEKTSKLPLKLDYQMPKAKDSFAAYYKEYIRREFDKWAAENPKDDGGIYDLDIDGLKVYTTLNVNIQKSAERVMRNHMNILQNSFEEAWLNDKEFHTSNPIIRAALLNSSYARFLKEEEDMDDAAIIKKFEEKGPRVVWTWKGWQSMEMTKVDSIKHYLTMLHTGILAIDPRNGKILAWVGGNDYQASQYDNIEIVRQVGSTFKPIVYLAGVDAGLDPCEYYNNTLKKYTNYEDWTPKNADGRYGGSYSMMGALANSVNTVSVQVILKTGIQKVIDLARKMGITGTLKPVPSLVLGAADANLYDMVKAYGSIANGGLAVEPYAIERIEDEDGKVIYQHKQPKSQRIVNNTSVQKVQKMMEAVVTQGTASSLAYYNIPVTIIGKTGTTQNQADGWFIGASPELVVGSWVGTLDPRIHFKSMLGAGASTALPMVGRIFSDVGHWQPRPLTNFSYTIPAFNCYSYVPVKADSAKYYIMPDTIKVDTLVRDSIKIDSLKLPLDTTTLKLK